MTYENADNTYAMGDHHDHIHVGWRPSRHELQGGQAVNAVSSPSSGSS
jgi:hypothetical protein